MNTPQTPSAQFVVTTKDPAMTGQSRNNRMGPTLASSLMVVLNTAQKVIF